VVRQKVVRQKPEALHSTRNKKECSNGYLTAYHSCGIVTYPIRKKEKRIEGVSLKTTVNLNLFHKTSKAHFEINTWPAPSTQHQQPHTQHIKTPSSHRTLLKDNSISFRRLVKNKRNGLI